MKNSVVRRAVIRIACAGLLVALAVGVLLYRQTRNMAQYDVRVVPPTCSEAGYSLYTHRQSGATQVKEIVPALGHVYSDWTQTAAPDRVFTGTQVRSCSRCSEAETRFAYPQLQIPSVRLTGSLDGIGKKSEVLLDAEYVSEEVTFEAFAALKYQGHSTLNFSKKNYTLKLYRDAERNEKYKLTFSHWNPENKYILKANYTDPSQCRNLVCADLWADMVKSRSAVPRELEGLSNYGAVDGFPVALYINGQFMGLYNMNLHKDDDLFAMKEGQQHAILIANKNDGAEACFLTKATFTEDGAWEVEYCGTEDSTWAREKLNALIAFVQEADDATFRAQLSNHLDIDSAVDYLLAVYAMGLTTHGTKDLMLVTYGEEAPWHVSLYDMENAFGLLQNGNGTLPPERVLPVQMADGWDSATGSLLWDRFLEHFMPRLKARYTQLRQGILAPDALCGRVDAFVAAIPGELYAADAAVNGYPAQAPVGTAQITQYIQERTRLLDGIFLNKEG